MTYANLALRIPEGERKRNTRPKSVPEPIEPITEVMQSVPLWQLSQKDFPRISGLPAEKLFIQIWNRRCDENSVCFRHFGGALRMDRVQRWRVKLKFRRIKWRADCEFYPGVAYLNVHRHGGAAAVSCDGTSLGRNFAGCHELRSLEFFRFEYCERERSGSGHGLGVGHCDHHSTIEFKDIERSTDDYRGSVKLGVGCDITGCFFDPSQYHPAIYRDRNL